MLQLHASEGKMIFNDDLGRMGCSVSCRKGLRKAEHSVMIIGTLASNHQNLKLTDVQTMDNT